MRVTCLLFFTVAFSLVAQADVLTLRNGSTVSGQIQSADANQVNLSVNGQVSAYPFADIRTIVVDPRPAAAAAAAAKITTGTIIVRTIDAIDSKTAQIGQTFRASLDEPVVVDGVTLKKGADAEIRLVEAQEAGKLKGKAALTLQLVSITVEGKVYEVNSQNVSVESGGKGKSSAAKIGIGTGIGAAVGGILGGGKGAAIGAGAGAAAGTTLALLTGPEVRVPVETRLEYKLQ